MIGRYRVAENTVSDTWAELDDYIARSCEFIRQTYPYSERELLDRHEVEFFRTLRRAEQLHKDRAKQAEERRLKLQQARKGG